MSKNQMSLESFFAKEKTLLKHFGKYLTEGGIDLTSTLYVNFLFLEMQAKNLSDVANIIYRVNAAWSSISLVFAPVFG